MSQSLTVRRALVCAALALSCVAAAPSVAEAQTTALFIDSQPGDPVGKGARWMYATPDVRISASTAPGNGASFLLFAEDDFWSLHFRASGVRLTPGAFENAFQEPWAPLNALSVSSGIGCGRLNGRFVVLEAEYAADGTPLRFAVDFEQHCNDGAPGLFGAFRFNSTISSLTPFGGLYPRYHLAITSSPHGSVTGPGIDCGLSSTQCEIEQSATGAVTLTATPEAGYVFLGWTGGCIGGVTASIVINGPRSCGAVFGPDVPPSPRTFLVLDGEPGSSGGGLHEILAGDGTSWTLSNQGYFGIRVEVTRADAERREMWLAANAGGMPGPGIYEGAVDRPWYGRPQLDMRVGSPSCSGGGRFEVYELAVNSTGVIERFSADVEYHCTDATPGLFAAIRYNASTATERPFDGDYPRYELSVTPAAHGRVEGPELSCGAGATLCSMSLEAAGAIALVAVADPGYVFAGWTGSCTGSASTTLTINGPKVCAAAFEPVVPAAPRTLFVFDSQPGDISGGGHRSVYSNGNSRVQTYTDPNGHTISLRIEASDGTSWYARFGAPPGERLSVGTYVDYTISDFGPLLEVNCGGTGRFIIREIDFGSNGGLTRLAADLELHCGDREAGLFGLIRYNSTSPGVEPFDGAYPAYELTVSAAGGRVTGEGIDCGETTSVCQRSLLAPERMTLTATPRQGHVFIGWAGACSGLPVTSVLVNGLKSCRALFEPVVPTTPRSVMFVESQAGDYIGGGRQAFYATENTIWTVEVGAKAVVYLELSGHDGTTWRLSFAAPGLEDALNPRLYTNARRTAFRGIAPGLDISSSGKGCNETGGRFLVHEVEFAPDGRLLRFAADFEQHCEEKVPALFGAVRYNTTLPLARPFAGLYPSYRMTVVPAAHGTVTGAGVECGTGGLDCDLAFGSATTVTLTARPDRGYVFGGWTGACGGAAADVTLLVFGPRDCTASFVPLATVQPGTMMALIGSPNEPLGHGRSYYFNRANAIWSVKTFSSGALEVEAGEAAGTDTWNFIFAPPTSRSLAPGFYRVAGTASGAARLSSWGTHYCSSSGYGYFVIHDLAIAGNEVQRLAIDFELRCGSATTVPLKGIIRHNTRITPRALSWGTHLLVEGAGAGGGPHVQGIDATGRVDAQYNFFAYDQRFTGGVAVAYGDVDGDGAADVVTAAGAGGGPDVRVITSAPAAAGQPAALRELANFFAYDPAFYGGVSVAVGDVTGDGIAEIVTGPGRGGGPHVRVFQLQPATSTTPAKIVEYAGFLAYAAGFTGGIRVAVGDLDGDGMGEVITSPGAGGGPDVRAYKVTADKAVPFASFFAYDPEFTGGVFVAAADVNGDGQDDIITGADAGGGPQVRVVTRGPGGGLVELTTFFAYDTAFSGGVRVGAGDLDGDGRAEIITGAGPGGGPHVMAIRRADDGTLSLAASFFAYAPGFTGGVFVAGATR